MEIPVQNVTLFGKRTSIRLEEPFYLAAEQICHERCITFEQFCEEAHRASYGGYFTSRLRVHIFLHFKKKATTNA